MLHRLAVILLGLVTSVTPGHAQDNLKMLIETNCEGITSLRSYLREEHGEIAFTSAPGIFRRFDGQFAEGLFRTYLNPKTFTYTMTVEFVNDDVACIISMGEEFGPVLHDGTQL